MFTLNYTWDRYYHGSNETQRKKHVLSLCLVDNDTQGRFYLKSCLNFTSSVT